MLRIRIFHSLFRVDTTCFTGAALRRVLDPHSVQKAAASKIRQTKRSDERGEVERRERTWVVRRGKGHTRERDKERQYDWFSSPPRAGGVYVERAA